MPDTWSHLPGVDARVEPELEGLPLASFPLGRTLVTQIARVGRPQHEVVAALPRRVGQIADQVASVELSGDRHLLIDVARGVQHDRPDGRGREARRLRGSGALARPVGSAAGVMAEAPDAMIAVTSPGRGHAPSGST